MAKLSSYPQSPRNLLNVYAYLLSSHSSSPTTSLEHPTIDNDNLPPSSAQQQQRRPRPDAETYYLSESLYLSQRTQLLQMETEILRRLGFEVHVALPYTLAINYLQALDIFRERDTGQKVTRRTFEHLTSALYSPQLLYLTHQPTALATAAIYLAARECEVNLSAGEWWSVFDVEREDLGFLVLALGSMRGFAKREKQKKMKEKEEVKLDVGDGR